MNTAEKRGYKQTEVGVIPEHWEVRNVGELVRSGPRNGYSGRSSLDPIGTPTLSLSATTLGRLVLNADTVKYLEATVPRESDLFLKPDDVLVQRSNTIDLVGTTAIFTGPPDTFIYPDLMMRLRFRDAVQAQWFWRYANSSAGRRYFVSVAAGSTGSMPKLSGDKLRDMPIPFPTLKAEREAITTALSDADALIESLEQLVAKKRQIKHGAMQELLSGQRRLPGFTASNDFSAGDTAGQVIDLGPLPKDWVVRPLLEVGRWYSGGTPSMKNEAYWSGDIPWASPKDMKVSRLHDTIDHITSKAVNDGARLLPSGTVLMVIRGMILAHSFPVARAERPLACNQDMKALVVHQNIDSNYVLYWLTAHAQKLRGLTTESTHGTKRLPPETLYRVPFPTPPTKAEQEAIAGVLGDMDTEIEQLSARLAKARLVKQGMMQELLTGRTRLV
jgi:type I restriction enzyme, S subunit